MQESQWARRTARACRIFWCLCSSFFKSLTPFYLDPQTTVRVALDDTAVKKSVWLLRRAAVIEDAVVHELIEPLYLTEKDMAADPFTKYLTYAVWLRHKHFMLNYKAMCHRK